MEARANRLSLIYSSAGHLFFHFFAAMYFTAVLALEKDWNAPYHQLVELWTPASILIGLAALPAGRISDMWSAPGMIVIMYLGMGISTVLCAFSANEPMLLAALAGIGLFGAIYHPVGIPWLIRSSKGNTGRLLAINGIFGGLGAACAGAVTGLLISVAGWQGAFLVPGVLCILFGLSMFYHWRTGALETEADGAEARARRKAKGGGQLSAFLLLMFPMFAIGLIYNTTQALMPKLFTEKAVFLVHGDIARAGLLVGVVYAVGAAMQLAGGWLADRFPLKRVYLVCWLVQAPLIAALAALTDLPLFGVALLLVVANTGALPAENMLLARFAPEKHHGLAFGVKFILAFGAAPIGVQSIAWVVESTGSFTPLFYGLAAIALLAVVVISLLPQVRHTQASQPAE